MRKEDVVHKPNGRLAIKKNKIMLSAATWMNSEIVLSEVNQRQISYDILYMRNLLKKWIQRNLFTKHKQTHKHSKTYGYQRGGGEG